MTSGRRVTEVVAGLLYREGRLLVCQRREDGAFPFKWEFPGGKVEEGEAPLAALRRELREELGIEIRSATEVFNHRHLYPNQAEVELKFFRVDDYRGAVTNLNFHRLLWVEGEELAKIDFLEGDLPLVEKILRREL